MDISRCVLKERNKQIRSHLTDSSNSTEHLAFQGLSLTHPRLRQERRELLFGGKKRNIVIRSVYLDNNLLPLFLFCGM